MSNHPTIAALMAALESERNELQNLFVEFDGDRKVEFIAKYPVLWNDVYDIMEDSRYHRAMINSMIAGHEAATERLMGLLEKAVEMAEHYDGMYIFDEADDDTECLDINKPWRCYSGKKAREFLTTLADVSGEMNKDSK